MEESRPRPFPLPRVLKEDVWMKYLERPLSLTERDIIHDRIKERSHNKDLVNLYTNAKALGYAPVTLIDPDGNCMFSSLVHLGIGKSIKDLREGLAFFMYILQDYKPLVPGDDLSLKEKYQMENLEGSSYVKCDKVGKIYKYTYNVMCQDITDMRSWTKLPANLLLFLVSYIYRVEILIIRDDSSFTNLISAWDTVIPKPADLQRIALGYIQTFHYMPFRPWLEESPYPLLLEEEAKLRYHTWAKAMRREKIKEFEIRTQLAETYAEQADSPNAPMLANPYGVFAEV